MDLDTILKQLQQDQAQQDQKQQEPEPQATQPEPEPQATQQPEPQAAQDIDMQAYEEYKRQILEWMNLGKQVFIAKYQGNPEVLKVLPYIEEKAKALLRVDIEANKPKEDFYAYMELARVEVQKELAETLQTLNRLNTPQYNQQTTQKKAQEKPYTVDDYYNDYKLMLEDITDENATVRFFDGVKTPEGKIRAYGEGKKKLGEAPKISVE